MSTDSIEVQERFSGQLIQITLTPPPANILTARMMGEIEGQLAQCIQNPSTKLVVIRGAGKHFSFGASVDEHTADRVGSMLPAFHRLVGKVLECEIPTLAQVSGMCLGGSFELVMACTFVWADETAKLGVPEIQLGVLPPVASVLLPLKCGHGASAEMILTGGTQLASDLQDSGLIQRVVPPGQLESVVDAFFEKDLQPKSGRSLRLAHRAQRMMMADTYRQYISRMEDLYLNELMATHDAVEGIASFLEKRKPVWKDA